MRVPPGRAGGDPRKDRVEVVGLSRKVSFLFTDAEYTHRDITLKEQMTRAKRTLTHHSPIRLPWPGSSGSCREAGA